MVATGISNADNRAEVRVERGQHLLLRMVAQRTAGRAHAARGAATVRSIDLGPARLSVLSFPPAGAAPTPHLMARREADCVQVCLPLRGDYTITQHGWQAQLRPQELLIGDTTHPTAVLPTGDGVAGELLTVWLPRAALALRRDRADALLGVRLAADHGMVPLISRFLVEVSDGTRRWRADDRSRLGAIAVDLVGALVAHHLGTGEPSADECPQQALTGRIRAYIDAHLGDPGLSPTTVAQAHHISVRYLHRLFQTHDHTVAEWIRNRRLERCRRDLDDPAQRLRPLYAIAQRHGFTRQAEFSRSFRRRYGVSPSEYRRSTETAE